MINSIKKIYRSSLFLSFKYLSKRINVNTGNPKTRKERYEDAKVMLMILLSAPLIVGFYKILMYYYAYQMEWSFFIGLFLLSVFFYSCAFYGTMRSLFKCRHECCNRVK